MNTIIYIKDLLQEEKLSTETILLAESKNYKNSHYSFIDPPNQFEQFHRPKQNLFPYIYIEEDPGFTSYLIPLTELRKLYLVHLITPEITI